MALIPEEFLKPSGSRTQEELDYELALKLDEQFRLESKALREAQEQADARIAQELARLEYGQGYSHNPLYQTQNLLDLDVPPVPVAPSISANPFNYTAVDPEYRRRQEEADEALARQLEEQFKEERSQRARENRPHSADFLLFDDSISAAAPVSSLRSTRGVSTEQLTQPLNSINDVVQCPICGVLFEQDVVEAHVNMCLDELQNSSASASESVQVPVLPQQAVVVNDYDPVTKSVFECPICTEEVAVGKGYKYEQCQHAYCADCLVGYYTTLIMNGKVTEIKCPDPTCTYKCTHKDIRFVLPDDTFQKYLEFLYNAEVNADPETKWCPTPGCVNAIRRKDKSSLKMTCNKCNFEFCFNCLKPHHEGKTCEEANKWSLFNKDIRVVLWEKFNTKPCPKCNARIQKKGGCNHMTCANCRYEFCWQCMKEYTHDHFDNSMCTMYGASPVLYYARRFAGGAIRRIFRGAFDSDSSDDYYSSSDDEPLTEKIMSKLEDVAEDIQDRWDATKEELADKWEETKASIQEKWVKFKSLFDK